MLNKENKITLDTSGFSAADTLKETLDYFHITQTEFANRLGVSQKHISDILNRRKFMSSELALKIEAVTGIPAEFLLKKDMSYQLQQQKRLIQNMTFNKFDWATSR